MPDTDQPQPAEHSPGEQELIDRAYEVVKAATWSAWASRRRPHQEAINRRAAQGLFEAGLLGPSPLADSRSILHSSDTIKALRETFCVAQTHIGESGLPNIEHHLELLERLIEDCDRQRPLGPDGVHGDRHTETCGCEDKPTTSGGDA